MDREFEGRPVCLPTSNDQQEEPAPLRHWTGNFPGSTAPKATAPPLKRWAPARGRVVSPGLGCTDQRALSAGPDVESRRHRLAGRLSLVVGERPVVSRDDIDRKLPVSHKLAAVTIRNVQEEQRQT